MLTSKQRAEFRAQANTLETTLMVGKEGITEGLIESARQQLTARELIKGRVLESALLSAREVSDALCEELGAEGIQTIGSKFVIYKKNEKKAQMASEKQRNASRAKANPVRKGAQARRQQEKERREQRNAYFREAAIQAAIERRKQREK